jgi:molybdate transport system regulatory protein
VARVKLRVYFPGEHSLGPGKVALLEAVREQGSISAAARTLGMAYRHAWILLDDLNRCFKTPVVQTATGGAAGGGTTLTPLGEEIVVRYHRMQRRTERAIAGEIAALQSRTRRRATSS